MFDPFRLKINKEPALPYKTENSVSEREGRRTNHPTAWNEGVTPGNTRPDSPTGCAKQCGSQKFGKVGRNFPKPERLGMGGDMPGVYNISMVRMLRCAADEPAKERV